MTETQAKSGAAGADPVEQDGADGAAPATGRAVVGRATVPADAPKFTRPPGMSPPPNAPSSGGPAAGNSGRARGSATPVTSAPPAPTVASAPPASAPPASGPPPPGAAAGRTATATGTGVRGVGAARVTEAVRAARATVSAAARGPRRARLTVKRIDPWSVMKFSFAVSLVLFVVVIVATSVLYLALDAMGVFNSVNDSLAETFNASGASSGDTFRVTAKGVIGTAVLIGAVNVVLFTALATLAAFIYNVCADLVGGIELTLSERD
jgi:hypothetical protein